MNGKTEGPAIQDLKLVPAHLDFQNVRVQMVFGILLILAACALMSWKVQSIYAFATFQPLSFALYFGCCTVAALVSLEICGLYGNTFGAVPAIWTGLLLAIHPSFSEYAQLTDSFEISRLVACTLLILISLLFYQRFRALAERRYIFLSLAAFIGALLTGLPALMLPLAIAVYEVLFAINDHRTPRPPKPKIASLKYVAPFFVLPPLVSFAIPNFSKLINLISNCNAALSHTNHSPSELFSFLFFTWPWVTTFGSLMGTIDLNTPMSVRLAITIIAVLLVYRIRSTWRMIVWYAIWILPLLFVYGFHFPSLAVAAVCIVLPFIALPAFDHCGKMKRSLLGLTGTISLLLFAFGWFSTR